MDYQTPAIKPDLAFIKKGKRCHLVDFVVVADHRVKIKEKYLDLARELKKLRNMKMTVMPILVGTLGTVHISLKKKSLEKLEI